MIQDTETLIQQHNANIAPRVTPADVESNIVTEYYFKALDATDFAGFINGSDSEQCRQSLELLTICILTLRNGFTVIGYSACASPENYNQEIGQAIARRNAVEKIWPLMGYELRTKLCTEAV
jgi:hypothetical protein